MIPTSCPQCGAQEEWKECINPFTTGIPLGRFLRIRIGCVGTIRFHKYTYRCEKCGFEAEYDDRDHENSRQKRGRRDKALLKRYFGK